MANQPQVPRPNRPVLAGVQPPPAQPRGIGSPLFRTIGRMLSYWSVRGLLFAGVIVGWWAIRNGTTHGEWKFFFSFCAIALAISGYSAIQKADDTLPPLEESGLIVLLFVPWVLWGVWNLFPYLYDAWRHSRYFLWTIFGVLLVAWSMKQKKGDLPFQAI
jgi:hypothetical protein